MEADDYILKIIEKERKKAYIQGFKTFHKVCKNQAFLPEASKNMIDDFLEESLEALSKNGYEV